MIGWTWFQVFKGHFVGDAKAAIFLEVQQGGLTPVVQAGSADSVSSPGYHHPFFGERGSGPGFQLDRLRDAELG